MTNLKLKASIYLLVLVKTIATTLKLKEPIDNCGQAVLSSEIQECRGVAETKC